MTTKRTTLEARQGETNGAGRRILLGSLALAAVASLAGALNQSHSTTSSHAAAQ